MVFSLLKMANKLIDKGRETSSAKQLTIKIHLVALKNQMARCQKGQVGKSRLKLLLYSVKPRLLWNLNLSGLEILISLTLVSLASIKVLKAYAHKTWSISTSSLDFGLLIPYQLLSQFNIKETWKTVTMEYLLWKQTIINLLWWKWIKFRYSLV